MCVCGLINQNYWENSKWYYVNVERGNAADKLNGRNINVSFTNDSNVPIEVMVFMFYSDEITVLQDRYSDEITTF